MKDILLSVIVPVYNTEKYLEKCMESIIDQRYKNLEIICVDDGSTDNSGMILDEYCKKDNRIKVIHTRNNGLVKARKTGLLQATGEYSTYVDSDDWIERNMYEEMVKPVEGYGVDIVASGFIRDYGNHVFKDIEKAEPGYYTGKRMEEEILNRLINVNNPFEFLLSPSLCNKIYKTEMLRSFQNEVPDQVTIDEDTVVTLPMILKAKSLFVCGDSYYHYCSRDNSMLNEKGNSKKESYLIKIAYDYLRKIVERTLCDYYENYARLQMCPETVLSYKDDKLLYYGSFQRESKIIVYGAGSFGKSLHRYLVENDFNVIAWADKNGDGSTIIRPEQITEREYDVIVIGVLVAEITEEICNMLYELGISKDKVYRVSV